ncbi:MAG TPA: polyphosphate:AMP phosphotransferase [Burkholderiales bacterium]|nr:polyphosphate:AMP phosphotransferase [Burkholderiales bacterium]
MFESAELGHRISKATYDREEPGLREALLNAQYDLAQSRRFPVIILVGGVDGAGRSEVVNRLNEWMDPRHIEVNGMGAPTDEESQRPRMWRYWRVLPPKGKIGVFLGSWYTWPFLHWVFEESSDGEFDEALDEVVRFERMLADEGALILKFWLHLSKKGQKDRLKKLESDPRTRWRVSKRDWEHLKLYDRFHRCAERAIRHTSTGEAPWTIVDGSDDRYRSLAVGKILLDALQQRLKRKEGKAPKVGAPPLPRSIDRLDVIRALDLTQRVTRKQYDKQLEKYQEKLARMLRSPGFGKRGAIVVFEGNDAAGKGGSIRRVTGALDARQYTIRPVAAPTEEERAQPYLWRFWRHVPLKGRLMIFDRSWYGRVLVERVEGFASQADWMRAYSEINDFEAQLAEAGYVLAKFWLAISRDEQMRRFREREKTAFKRFKITAEDWRNRKKWDPYEQAVCEMVERTSSDISPWTLVEANDKYFARIKVLRTLCARIEQAL